MASICFRRWDFWGMSKMTSQIFEATEEFLDVCFGWRTHASFSFAYGGNLPLTWIFNELVFRDRGDGCDTGKPQGVGFEAYLNSTSQDPAPEDDRKDGQTHGRSRQLVKYPG